MLNVYKHLLFELMGFVILPPINWWSSHYPVTVACMLRNKSCCSVPSCTLICSYQAADTILLFPSTKHELESVMQIARTCFPCYSDFRQLVKCLLSNFDIFYEVVRMSNPIALTWVIDCVRQARVFQCFQIAAGLMIQSRIFVIAYLYYNTG